MRKMAREDNLCVDSAHRTIPFSHFHFTLHLNPQVFFVLEKVKRVPGVGLEPTRPNWVTRF